MPQDPSATGIPISLPLLLKVGTAGLKAAMTLLKPGSTAAKIIGEIRQASISRLPGYREAAWEINEEGPQLVSLMEMVRKGKAA